MIGEYSVKRRKRDMSAGAIVYSPNGAYIALSPLVDKRERFGLVPNAEAEGRWSEKVSDPTISVEFCF